MSKALEDWGLDITFIHFGAHKVDGNPYEALSKDVKDRIQAKINDLGEQFVALVARNRGLDEKAIRDTEALTYTATESVANGLADNIGPLDDALAAFAVDLSTSEGDSEMSDKTATAADNSAVIESARAEGHASGFAAGVAEGSVSAKARISAILGGENAKARPSAALSAAMDTDMTAEQANTFLGKIPAETVEAAAPVVADNKQNFSAAMSEEKNEVGGDDNAKSDGKADADNASSILDLSASFGISGLRKRS
jgi:ClpP class serine protease